MIRLGTRPPRDLRGGRHVPVERQRRALDIVQLKLDVLWSMLDAMYMAYVLKMPPYFNEAEQA